MQDKYYLPVNWVDGMKINKSHFIAQDNAAAYQLAQHTACLVDQLNYGLLPQVGERNGGVKLFISTDNQKRIQVRIQHCRAITAGGYYIEFNEDTALQGNNLIAPIVSEPITLRELKVKATSFYIVLTIDPYKRIPYGSADAAEMPPRIPHTLPALYLDIIPVAEVVRNVLGPTQLPVGKMTVDAQRVMLEEEYIPPCTSISSHPELQEIQAGLEQFYSKMELYALQITQKIIQKKQANDMSVIVQKICDNISFFTATQLSEIKSVGVVQRPVYTVSGASALARMIKNTLDCYLGSGKEELVNYFTEWCNIAQGELESTIAELSTLQYDHLDINDSIGKVARFTKTISRLFYQLSKLEYIGKRRESGIFVKEEVVKGGQEIPQQQRRRSFLAD
ncbi:MAG: hypothetical protein QM802_03540 [Agriterribacter sp.]